jgi:hypothetical protein
MKETLKFFFDKVKGRCIKEITDRKSIYTTENTEGSERVARAEQIISKYDIEIQKLSQIPRLKSK